MDLALGLCRDGLEDFDVHRVIAIQLERAEFLPNPRWADQYEDFTADGVIAPHRPPYISVLSISLSTPKTSVRSLTGSWRIHASTSSGPKSGPNTLGASSLVKMILNK